MKECKKRCNPTDNTTGRLVGIDIGFRSRDLCMIERYDVRSDFSRFNYFATLRAHVLYLCTFFASRNVVTFVHPVPF